MALRWGIASGGKISHDFVSSLQVLPKTDHQVVAVATRCLDTAQDFGKRHTIRKTYEGYQKLAEDADIDIVYIGCLNPEHFELSKMMLEHGKHVLCEKPMTMNKKQTRQLVEIARNKKLFLAEGVWSRSFPAYAQLRKLIDSGAIGDILHVSVSFGFYLQEVERLKSKSMGGGTILDLGVYTLQFQQFVFKDLKPIEVIARGSLNSEGTDDAVTAILTYSGGKTAVITTSAKGTFPNEAVVVGSKGIIRLPDFWCPTQLITPEETYEYPLPQASGKFNFYRSVGLSYQAEVIRQCIKSGKIETENITHEESIQLAHLMDSLRQQVGVVFPQDSL